MNSTIHFRLPGYGLSGGADTAVAIGTSVAQGASAAALTSTATGAALLTSLGTTAAVAVPVAGAIIAGIAIGIEAILHSGCGQTCIETSQWANQAAPLLQQNVDAYFAIKAPRPRSVQQSALANFDNVWNRLVQLCSQPGLGDAGKNCIGDRQSGACKWKASGPPQYPGQPAQGACWNWFNGYRDPIANDTQTYDDSVTGAMTAAGGGIASAVGGTSPLLWIGAAVLAALFLVSRT